MSTIDSVDQFNDVDVTEMKPYSVRWSFGLDGREVSVLLPADTKYKRGPVSILDKDGFIKFSPPLFIEGSYGIHLFSSGKGNIIITSKTQKLNEIVTSRREALVSLFILPKKVSKEALLNGLKKKNVQVLSESENSLLTKAKTARIFSKTYDETLVKTMMSGDVVLQIQVTTYGRSSDALLVELFDKIRLVSKAQQAGLSPILKSFFGENFLKRGLGFKGANSR